MYGIRATIYFCLLLFVEKKRSAQVHLKTLGLGEKEKKGIEYLLRLKLTAFLTVDLNHGEEILMRLFLCLGRCRSGR